MEYFLGVGMLPLPYGVFSGWWDASTSLWSILWMIGCFYFLMEYFMGGGMLPLLYGVFYGWRDASTSLWSIYG